MPIISIYDYYTLCSETRKKMAESDLSIPTRHAKKRVSAWLNRVQDDDITVKMWMHLVNKHIRENNIIIAEAYST